MKIPQRDWKEFKRLRALGLERLSQKILDESRAICAQADNTAHQRYLELFKLLRDRDRDVAATFDHFSGSWAISDLMVMRVKGLLGDEDIQGLSNDIREATLPLDL